MADWYFTERLESFIRNWLYNTLDAASHWFRYEYQSSLGSIHCHGAAKLRNDPDLCNLTDKALRGVLTQKQIDEGVDESLLDKLHSEVQDGKIAPELSADVQLGTFNL